MLTKLYRRILPHSLRQFIYDFVLSDLLIYKRNIRVLSKGKLHYWLGFLLPKSEQNSAYAFIGKYGLTSYPNSYMLEYKNKPVDVYRDNVSGLPYVLHNEKKLFFRKNYSDELVRKDYLALITEQDIRAAHRYVRSYDELRGKVLLDVGSAEGIFSLDTIEYADHIYLFEYDKDWIEPLNATFDSWKHKVTIIQKYVWDSSSENHIILDDFFSDKPNHNIFIKMDIEGAERRAFSGAVNLLNQGTEIQLAVTTYHRKGDPEYLQNLFESNGFKCEFSDGYMYWGGKLSKGVIRCRK